MHALHTLTRNQLVQRARKTDDHELGATLQRLSQITSELQESVMRTRMQPIGNAWSQLPRLVRDLGLELGKPMTLEMHGAETELDRQVLEPVRRHQSAEQPGSAVGYAHAAAGAEGDRL